MLSIRLPPDIEKRLTGLAKMTGRTKSYYVLKLIEEDLSLEDLEDIYIAEKALEDPEPSLTSEQVKKALGLDN